MTKMMSKLNILFIKTVSLSEELLNINSSQINTD